MFSNLRELVATMPDEETCRKYLVKQRWDDKPLCPFCGSGSYYVIDNGRRYKCSNNVCNMKYSVTTNTIFHASKVPLNKWLMAYYICYSHKKGISSYQLAKDIGCTQRTAWFMMHRIRESMKPVIDVKLDGIIEIDEVYVRGSIKNKHKSVRDKIVKRYNPQTQKTGVIGFYQREGILKIEVLETKNYDGVNLKPILRKNIDTSAVVITDGFGAYAGLDKEYAQHEIINHAKDEYFREGFHTNTIEGFWSILKRGIYGIYHQVSPKHLHRYCAEFTTRYNTRKMKDAERFINALPNIENKRLDYKTLTGKK